MEARRSPGGHWLRFGTPGPDLSRVHAGDLVWIYGPRRHDLARATVDDTLPRGGVVVRDVAGLAASEIIRIVRIDDEERPVLNPKPV